MVFRDHVPTAGKSAMPEVGEMSNPRISFSTDLFDEKSFISICPSSRHAREEMEPEQVQGKVRVNGDFEFLSNGSSAADMLTADELFFEGKLLPFCQMEHSEGLNRLSFSREAKGKETEEAGAEASKEQSRASWFVDEDPSPRPPNCTVLWKELLKLRKHSHKASCSSSSSSSYSSSSSSSSSSSHSFSIPSSAGDGVAETEEGEARGEKYMKRIKKGFDRTRSANVRIRPMVNVPNSKQGRSSAAPSLSSIRGGRLQKRGA